MIKLLSISNLAVISSSQVEFGNGLNILSGETGSGKSIILTALGLLLGERASQDLLRTGESRAVVEGVFDIEGNLPLLDLLAGAGIDLDEGDLVIKREIVANGRGKIFVNNQPGTLHLLKAIQPHIIDVHGQGEQQSLLSTLTQTYLLDAFAGGEPLRSEVSSAYESLHALVKDWEDLRKTESERLQLLDLVEYQVNEIEQVNPLLNEDDELEMERRLLVNAEKLSTLCADIVRLLYDDDDAVIGKIGLAHRRIDDLAEIDPQFLAQSEHLSNSKYILEDVAFAVRDFSDRITYSPARLQLVEERLSTLDRLKRKYGGSLNEVQNHLQKMKARQDELQHGEAREKKILSQIDSAFRHYKKLADDLSRLRRGAARELEAKLRKDLADVALEKAQFKIYFNAGSVNGLNSEVWRLLGDKLPETPITRIGNESSEFYFSANRGEEAKPLQSVASGGELSRLMLILKTNIAPTIYPRTLVFDEIDTGIGGRVADAVGIRLRKLSISNQVICVTHQAQIARYADSHLQVSKDIKGQRTITKIKKLEAQERINELARMIAGINMTEVTLQHAKELLEI